MVEDVSVTVGKNLTLPCPPHTLTLNSFYHWGGQDATGPWFLRSAKHYMITNDGTLLFANVKKSDLEYINNVENGVSCVIESKGEIRRLKFSQRFLLHEVGGTTILIKFVSGCIFVAINIDTHVLAQETYCETFISNFDYRPVCMCILCRAFHYTNTMSMH